MGGMQIMLDKGEENDWFASGFIRFFAVLFVAGMIGLVWCGSGGRKNPLINLKLFRFKNFAICCFLMMLVGGVLNANTVLQPQFMQQLLGYNGDHGRAGADGGRLCAGGHDAAGGICDGQRFPRARWRCRIHPVRRHVPLCGST